MSSTAATARPGSRRRFVTPGTVSPRRAVPASVPRPEYVDRPAPQRYEGPEVKDPEIIERMRVASRIAAQAMAEAAKHIAPGVTTDELDRVGHEFMLDHGAYPSTLGYRNFPKSLCTSVNEVICHGIPDSTVLADGDIVNIDVTAYVTIDGIGVHGDTDATYVVGDVDEESRLLVERTHEAMMRGIKAVAPGRQINVIGRVIEAYARRFGYGVVRDFTGHGSVRISAPASVTSTVCSNWALRRRSLVTTVQLSSHMSQSAVPSVSIGSIVNVIPGSITVA